MINAQTNDPPSRVFFRTADVQNQLIATYHTTSFAGPRELVEPIPRFLLIATPYDF